MENIDDRVRRLEGQVEILSALVKRDAESKFDKVVTAVDHMKTIFASIDARLGNIIRALDVSRSLDARSPDKRT